jgi:hypothetical protein
MKQPLSPVILSAAKDLSPGMSSWWRSEILSAAKDDIWRQVGNGMMMKNNITIGKFIMSLTLIDRFHSQLRVEQQKAIDAGQVRVVEEMALLEPEQLQPLAVFSLQLLILSGLFFIALNYASYYAQTHTFGLRLTLGGVLLWLVINIVGYVVILPLHELVHAAAFLSWGGKPYFGVKAPYALFCGAKNQVFRRNQYLVIGLAPLVVITLAAIIFTLFSPVLASYTLFASIGNFSGAAGDIWSVQRMLRWPASVLIEDTEDGYRIWQLTPDSPRDRIAQNTILSPQDS